MLLISFLLLPLAVISAKTQVPPMYAQHWNAAVCTGAPQKWRKGAMACSNSDVATLNPVYWSSVKSAMAANGFNEALSCTVFTKLNKGNCDSFCADRGTNCYGGSDSQGNRKPHLTGANYCKEATTHNRGCNTVLPPDGRGKAPSYLCTCGPFKPDCVYPKRPMGERCNSVGDPHIYNFPQFSGDNVNVNQLMQARPTWYIQKKVDYQQVGEFKLFAGVYEGKDVLEIQTRQVMHPARTKVAVNQAVVVTGSLLCGHKIEVLAATPDLAPWAGKGKGTWTAYPYKLIIDGAEVPGSNEAIFIATINSWGCKHICGAVQHTSKKGVQSLKVTLEEGTIVDIGDYKNPFAGLAVNFFAAVHMMSQTASYVTLGTQSGQPAGLRAGGFCFGNYDGSHVPCNESNFTPVVSYYPNESCNDHQPDPNRPSVIPDPITTCQVDQKALYKEAKKLCNKSCPTKEIAETCIFDACIMESIDGVQMVSEMCDFDEELEEEVNPLPTPKPTHACNPLLGVKFKYNKGPGKGKGKIDDGIRPYADMTFTRDIWDQVYEHNHGHRHLQKKFYKPELQGLSFAEIACLCHDYCAVVGTPWFQVNVKKRTRAVNYGLKPSLNAFAKCQCYEGEPVFKKLKPTYATGYVSNWAYNWYHGIGPMSVSRANNFQGVGVTWNVPETPKIETIQNPHVKNNRTNDFVAAGFGNKLLRQINEKALRKWHGKKNYRQLGSPTEGEFLGLPTITNINQGTSPRTYAGVQGQYKKNIGAPNYVWNNHSPTGRRLESEMEEDEQ